ncbi:glycosyl hydrolase, partial [Streptomyces diastatochromogenes]
MSLPTRRRRWFTVCALTASAALVAIPPSAASGRGGVSPFGVRTLGQLAKEREQSVGKTVSPAYPHLQADDDDGNEADEIAEGADQYAEARTSPGVVAPGANSAAWRALRNLPSADGRGPSIPHRPSETDHPRYR